MNWKFMLAVLFAVILVLGCSSSKTSETGTANTGTTQAETTTTTAGTTTTTTGTAPDFSNLVGMSPLTAYSITYTTKSSYGGDTQIATLKQVISGTKMKYEVTTEDSPVKAVTILTDDKYYTCTLGTGQDMCFEMAVDTTQPTTADQASETAKSFENTPNIVYDGTKTIAGTTTYCYKVTSDGADYKFCLEKSHGMLLGMYSTVAGTTTEMEATSFSTTAPSDSEFVLPAQVQQMPSYGG